MKTKARYYGGEIYYGGEMKVEDMEKFLGDLRESIEKRPFNLEVQQWL